MQKRLSGNEWLRGRARVALQRLRRWRWWRCRVRRLLRLMRDADADADRRRQLPPPTPTPTPTADGATNYNTAEYQRVERRRRCRTRSPPTTPARPAQGIKIGVIDTGINPGTRRVRRSDRPRQPGRCRQPRPQRRGRSRHCRSAPLPRGTQRLEHAWASLSIRPSSAMRADEPGTCSIPARMAAASSTTRLRRASMPRRCRRQGHQHVAWRLAAEPGSCWTRCSRR